VGFIVALFNGGSATEQSVGATQEYLLLLVVFKVLLSVLFGPCGPGVGSGGFSVGFAFLGNTLYCFVQFALAKLIF
jgi:hypothetical protein